MRSKNFSQSVWRLPAASEGAKDDSQEEAARQLCLDSRPPEDLELLVIVRSHQDPYLVAGEVTACRYEFGRTAGALRRDARLFAIIGAVCTSPLLLGLVWYLVGAARRKCGKAGVGAAGHETATVGRDHGRDTSRRLFLVVGRCSL